MIAVKAAYKLKILGCAVLVWAQIGLAQGQEAQITSYSVNSHGQVELEVNSTPDHYYILQVRNQPDGDFEFSTSMTMGSSGTTIITEPLAAYPIEHYRVLEYPIDQPADTDGDGIDDVTEFENSPSQAPLNAAPPVDMADGVVTVNSMSMFNELSLTQDVVQWSEFLNEKKYVKYLITDFHTSSPKVYFMNTKVHVQHSDFGNAVGVQHVGDEIKKGQIIFQPSSVSSGGTLGTFAFNYSGGEYDEFSVIQKTHELLAANMPLVKNNLAYFITAVREEEHAADSALFASSRLPVMRESDLYAGIDYWGLNPGEAFGLLRKPAPNEIPGSRDIVLYESVPNSLPKVGGIITTVIQTPLSHVNLRAIQDGIPNAFIRNSAQTDDIENFIGQYIFYKVEQSGYTIREATSDEVNAWFERIRPDETQIPPLNLSYTDIASLDDISFAMSDGYGAKCANVATMRTFGFPEGTIPEGFGIPFYHYVEFMEHNGLFEAADSIMNRPDFQADINVRNWMLAIFRGMIRQAEMPDWMMDDLAAMHAAFPAGTSVRCRSSTNNEDLPGFSGAGLYDSKTQHPDEGHISKSVKQIYASMWNLRAFEEREFHRVDHFKAAMGVLCHPNYSDEKVNGVGVSTDPLYQTDQTFYLNSQMGEDLVTNPNNASIAEEVLIEQASAGAADFTVIQRSNMIPTDSMLMGDNFLREIRDYLTVIHNEFAKLYNAEDNPTFAMDIEYKITTENQLSIKQARPWVSFKAEEQLLPPLQQGQSFLIYPNPASQVINVHCNDCDIRTFSISDIAGRAVDKHTVNMTEKAAVQISLNGLPKGVYVLSGFEEGGHFYGAEKFVKY